MRVICAWCESIIEYEERTDREWKVSHGICLDCAKRVLEEAGLDPRQFDLDYEPVLWYEKWENI